MVGRECGYHRLKMQTEFKTLTEKMFFDLSVVQGCSLRIMERLIRMPRTTIREEIKKYPWYAGVEVIHNKHAIKAMAMANGISVKEMDKEQNTVKICDTCQKKYRGPNKRTCPSCVRKRSHVFNCENVTNY
jgi:hypothetical protein